MVSHGSPRVARLPAPVELLHEEGFTIYSWSPVALPALTLRVGPGRDPDDVERGAGAPLRHDGRAGAQGSLVLRHVWQTRTGVRRTGIDHGAALHSRVGTPLGGCADRC